MKKHPIIVLLAIFGLFLGMNGFTQVTKAPETGDTADSKPAESQRMNAFRIDKIIGSRVINLQGENIGSIDNLVMDIDTGSIVYAVLEFGGFLSFGDKLFAVPWQSLAALPVEGTFILDQSKAKLEKAPGFNKNDWPDIGDKGWGAGIYTFYHRRVPFYRLSAAKRKDARQEKYPFYQPYSGRVTSPVGWEGANPFGWEEADPFRELFNPKTIETIAGRIVKVEKVGPETEWGRGIRLIIYTDANKPVLAYLGPAWYHEGQRKALKAGIKVTLTGSMVNVDDTPLMIATKIKKGNEELQLRDKEGDPTWIGWKKTSD
jgi:sporulation protein YlmC with PRC-barrel domain